MSTRRDALRLLALTPAALPALASSAQQTKEVGDQPGQVRRSLVVQKGRKFSIPEFKEWTQISRKYAVPLLEYLDRQRVTKREGDARVIL